MMQAKPISLNAQGEKVVSIGISGSRVGMSPLQSNILLAILSNGYCGELHHGDCIGVDAEVHDLIKAGFPDKFRVIVHPPANNALRAFKRGDETRGALPYLARNKNIVDECNVFFGMPKSREQVGGTWYTINYFRKVISDEITRNITARSGTIILPDGTIGTIVAEKVRKS